MDQGFVDLRQGYATGAQGSDSFWPSLTDIMTVVVMIFMLASTVLIIRNWELMDELRNTMEAEQRSAMMARNVADANATLEEQLAAAEHQLSLLRMQLMQADEKDQAKSRQLAEGEQNRLALEAEVAQLREQLLQAANRYAQLESQNRAQQNQLASARDEIAALQQNSQQQASELTRLRQDQLTEQQLLITLKSDFDELKVKYDKLIKPARTAKGKHVVEVRYEKVAGKQQIALRDEGQTEYRQLNKAEMEQILSVLKRANPGKLYVKIVIPDNSGLSYNEAWKFTKEVLQQFDYYYTEPVATTQ